MKSVDEWKSVTDKNERKHADIGWILDYSIWLEVSPSQKYVRSKILHIFQDESTFHNLYIPIFLISEGYISGLARFTFNSTIKFLNSYLN